MGHINCIPVRWRHDSNNVFETLERVTVSCRKLEGFFIFLLRDMFL